MTPLIKYLVTFAIVQKAWLLIPAYFVLLTSADAPFRVRPCVFGPLERNETEVRNLSSVREDIPCFNASACYEWQKSAETSLALSVALYAVLTLGITFLALWLQPLSSQPATLVALFYVSGLWTFVTFGFALGGVVVKLYHIIEIQCRDAYPPPHLFLLGGLSLTSFNVDVYVLLQLIRVASSSGDESRSGYKDV